MVGQLILRLFHARTVAHLLHLQTRSYAAHKALNEFYDGIVPAADAIAEAYQGDYGLIEPDAYKAPFEVPPTDSALVYLDDLGDWIAKNRSKFWDADDTYLSNLLDVVMELIRSTQYKLRFLK